MPEFRAVVLGQIGDSRLAGAIDADIAGETSRASALDADTEGAFRNIHRRVGTVILFESSGGQFDKVAHLPESRFARGEPDADTTTVDSCASALAESGFFVRKRGADGYFIHHNATLQKVVSDRRASLDERTEIEPAVRKLVKEEFARGATVPIAFFPGDGDAASDSPRLTLAIVDPVEEWTDGGRLLERLGGWTRERAKSPRLYPAALVWCARRPGRELRESTARWLAWRRVAADVAEGILGAEFDQTERTGVQGKVKEAEGIARDEVWAGYRCVALWDAQAQGEQSALLKTVDLGAGHASASESLGGRVIGALTSQGLLDETIGAGYIGRHWPPVFAEAGAWSLVSLRQGFLDGSLTRLLDPDEVLCQQVVRWVDQGSFGLASGEPERGDFGRVWFEETVGREEIAFESGVFLRSRERASRLRQAPAQPEAVELELVQEEPPSPPEGGTHGKPRPERQPPSRATVRVEGSTPPESWNRSGRTILPKVQPGENLCVDVDLRVSADAAVAGSIETEVNRAVDELVLGGQLQVEREDSPDGG